MKIYTAALALLWPALIMLSCRDSDPLPGALDGPCHVSVTPCDDGLFCNEGMCKGTPGSVEQSFAVSWEFKGPRAVEADGEASVLFRIAVTDANTQEMVPENTRIRLWVEPAASGTLVIQNPRDPVEGLILTDADGFVTARFVGCDKEDPTCVHWATIRVGLPPNPLTPQEAVVVENLGVMGDPFGTGGSGAGGSGEPTGPTEQLTWGPLGKCGRGEFFLQTRELDSFQGTGETIPVRSWSVNWDREERPEDLELAANIEGLGDMALKIKVVEGLVHGRFYDSGTGNMLGASVNNESCTASTRQRFVFEGFEQVQGEVTYLFMSFSMYCGNGVLEGCINVRQD